MNSMTGFGVGRGKAGGSHIVIEARSVNHRFCEVNLRFPGRFAGLEPEVTKRVRQHFSRGKFDLYLREESRDLGQREVALARRTHHLLKQIRKELSLRSDITLSDLLAFRGILFSQRPEEGPEKIRRPLLKLVDLALSGVRRMREREGKSLRDWFEARVKRLLVLLASIEKNASRRGPEYRQRLDRKMKGMVGEMDEARLAQEAAMMAERADVTEEIVRLRSHLQELRRYMTLREPAGRKLDFLAQEMGREINTIGSKSQGIRLAHQVVEFKAELERIREQVQNVE